MSRTRQKETNIRGRFRDEFAKMAKSGKKPNPYFSVEDVEDFVPATKSGSNFTVEDVDDFVPATKSNSNFTVEDVEDPVLRIDPVDKDSHFTVEDVEDPVLRIDPVRADSNFTVEDVEDPVLRIDPIETYQKQPASGRSMASRNARAEQNVVGGGSSSSKVRRRGTTNNGGQETRPVRRSGSKRTASKTPNIQNGLREAFSDASSANYGRATGNKGRTPSTRLSSIRRAFQEEEAKKVRRRGFN